MPRVYTSVVKVGDVVITNKGEVAKLVEYHHSTNCVVEFEDGTRVRTHATSFRLGKTQNPNRPSMAGVGFIGVPRDGEPAVSYPERNLWAGILSRCYNPKPNVRTYDGCTVDPRWHCFQDFRDWFRLSEYKPGWQLDKDVAVKGNKVYGPDTAFFVPKEINTFTILRASCRGPYPTGVIFCKRRNAFFSQISKGGVVRPVGGPYSNIYDAANAYKAAKESHARELAAKYKGQVNDKIYYALNNYVLEEWQQYG